MTAPTSAQNVLQLIAPSPRVTGSVLWGPLSATLPTTSYAQLVAGTGTGPAATGLGDLGFLSEDGLKQRETRSTTDMFAWGGSLVGTLQDRYDRTLTYRLLQFNNQNVAAASYGIANVAYTAATTTNGNEIAIQMNSRLLDTRAWVFDGIYNAQPWRVS
jgi:hypothetical protein